MIAEDYISLKASSVVLGSSIALRSKSEQDGAELPQRIKIFDWGENTGRTTGARIVVGAETLKVLSANQETQARDTIALDYEHQSFPGHPEYKPAPNHVAAHGQIEVIDGEGVFLHSVGYTPNGEEFAANYPDVSPVAYTDDQDNLIFIHSVALTQNGDVAGLAFANALSAATENLSKTQTKPNTATKTTMETDDTKSDKYRDMLVTLLKLKPAEGESEVSDEAIAAALSSTDKPMPKKETEEEATALSALNARFDKMERNQLVQTAVGEGKSIPLSSEDIEAMPVAMLSNILAKLPAGAVPTVSKVGNEKPSDKPVALSADQKKLAINLGLTEEEFTASL